MVAHNPVPSLGRQRICEAQAHHWERAPARALNSGMRTLCLDAPSAQLACGEYG